jgi:hypothetical protein
MQKKISQKHVIRGNSLKHFNLIMLYAWQELTVAVPRGGHSPVLNSQVPGFVLGGGWGGGVGVG